MAILFDRKYVKAIMFVVLVLTCTVNVECSNSYRRHLRHGQKQEAKSNTSSSHQQTLNIVSTGSGSSKSGLGSYFGSRGTMNEAYPGPSQGGTGH